MAQRHGGAQDSAGFAASPEPVIAEAAGENQKHTVGRDDDFCPVCKVKVKASRLEKHARDLHGSCGAKMAVRSAADVTTHSTTFVAPRDKNLDATKLYAHSYREQGRFGSHPSHDGFDDESGPE